MDSRCLPTARGADRGVPFRWEVSRRESGDPRFGFTSRRSSVQVNIETTYRALLELLPERFVVVLRPDVPNLLRGPDLIIGGEGRLFAIFKFQAAEQRSPDRLLVRLALARLALPRHTLCVLLWRSERADGETAAITTHFHSMISEDSPAMLVDHVLNSDAGERTQQTAGDIQGRQYRRAAAVMSLSSDWLRAAFPGWPLEETSRNPKRLVRDVGHVPLGMVGRPSDLFEAIRPSMRERFQKVRARSWFRGTKTVFPTLLEYENVILGAASGARLTTRLARFNERLLLRTASLDNGVPYPRTVTQNLLVVDRVPTHRFDPMKAIRAACFAGWSLIGPPQLARLDQTLDELRALPLEE